MSTGPFIYQRQQLQCEGVSLQAIADDVGTPAYVYSYHALVENYRRIAEAFKSVSPLICYSMKANANLAVVRALVDAGSGLDVVSGGELFKALRAGCDPQKIVYAGVGKTDAEIRQALRVGILLFNVESIEELDAIERVATRAGKQASVAVRINPDVLASTHAHITTGSARHKFGIDMETAGRLMRDQSRWSHVRIRGLHIHIGSQILKPDPFVKAVKRVATFIGALRAEGISVEYLDVGGGMGIAYHPKDTPQTPRAFARALLPHLRKLDLQLIVEPGRAIVGNAGVLLTRVLYVKRGTKKTFVIVDAGMNDLLRPALYAAHHEIQAVRRQPQAGQHVVDVVGPVCETGDAFARGRTLPRTHAGDVLAVMSAGAYGFTMASQYNARVRPCEVMVQHAQHYVVRRRERHQDLIRHEVMPEELRA